MDRKFIEVKKNKQVGDKGKHEFIVELTLRVFLAKSFHYEEPYLESIILAPTIEIGNIWPPKGIDVFDPKAIPLLNTLILLCSGATVTYSHHAITAGKKIDAVWGLVLTIILAVIFTALQAFEYVSANFTITDGIYGSTFFMATGFHGFHVFIGTCFLAVCLVRLYIDHYTVQHHFGFEAAAFYWHFVDVVWLFLYVAVYYWGGF